MEHLPPEEMPPENIWHHEERLHAHFEQLKADRERKYSPGGEDWETVPGAETVDFDVSDEVRNLR